LGLATAASATIAADATAISFVFMIIASVFSQAVREKRFEVLIWVNSHSNVKLRRRGGAGLFTSGLSSATDILLFAHVAGIALTRYQSQIL
jgi:hypothetical protein